ncbi:MAG: glutamate racemase [Pseudomonadota bacterium]
MKESRPKLAFFDSGVGGISILDEVMARVSACDVVYVADSAKYPYGSLPESEIIFRVTRIAAELYKNFPFDCFVVACNTASTVVLPGLRSLFPHSIVGVVPAIKPAAELTKTGVIGLLATPGTIVRPYTDELVATFASQKKVLRLGSAKLVDVAEKKMRTGKVDLSEIEAELKPFLQQTELDVVVLACTHFPLLEAEFRIVLGEKVTLISSGQAVAQRVLTLLGAKNRHNDSHLSTITYISTSDSGSHENVRTYLSKWGIVNSKIDSFGL